MRLKIGLATMQPAWKLILQQEGMDFEFVDLNDPVMIDDYSLLLINKPLDLVKRGNLNAFLMSGGAAIICAPVFAEMYHHKLHSTHRKFCLPSSDSIFADLGLIDFYTRFNWIDSKKVKDLDANLKIQYQKMGNGFVLILPFNVNSLISNTQSRRKKFPFDRKELPSEIVAKVSKGKIREIVFRCLQFLHDQRKIPLVQKWRFPNDWRNFFMFRVDTDFCTAEQATALYELCKKHKIRGTWFVDTVSQETLQQVYAKMPDQEIALHCRRHLVFPDYKTNKENIENGLSDLKEAGITVSGFAAPFGDWNENLARVLSEKGFKYSTEFTLDYDDLPFFPIVNNKAASVLQIPIHPMSTGRMHRSHFSKEEKWNYYKVYMDNCLLTGNPIFLYHHPSHGNLDIFDKIFRYVNLKQINSLTYQEYADWWQKKIDLKIELNYDKNEISSEFEKVPDNIQLRISKNEEFAFANLKTTINLEKLN
ncbi:MAG: polysaccharide deacetylase family protein, partial [Candidatus Cloacimonadales bacterium]|nr:polysaccharide deacetylase family protein [Candidatus Cloacimonadales bacterium]